MSGADPTSPGAPGQFVRDRALQLLGWAPGPTSSKAGVKRHKVLDPSGWGTICTRIMDSSCQDICFQNALIAEPGGFHVMDRAYVDSQRPFGEHHSGRFPWVGLEEGLPNRWFKCSLCSSNVVCRPSPRQYPSSRLIPHPEDAPLQRRTM